MTDLELFQGSFWEWCEVHGLNITDVYNGAPFPATVDLNKLKAGIANLISRGFCD